MKAKKIGLFFGTFNPVHVGHLVIANHMAQGEGLDEVWLVVTPRNPLKPKSGLLSDHHRLSLVRLAVEDNPRLRAENFEFALHQPNYTVDSLAYITEKYSEHCFTLIMGEDNLRSIHLWKNYEVILRDYDILVYPRLNGSNSLNSAEFSHKCDFSRVRITKAPAMDVSASAIRSAIKEGKAVTYLLTPSVEEYVKEMHFYK